MELVVLVIHLLLALGIIGLVLLQRSEGGGLGIGGGSGGLGGVASAASTANVLTRATGLCAAGFFCTSILLAVLAGGHSNTKSVLETLDNPPAVVDTTDETSDNKLPKAQGNTESPEVPVSDDSKTPSAPISE